MIVHITFYLRMTNVSSTQKDPLSTMVGRIHNISFTGFFAILENLISIPEMKYQKNVSEILELRNFGIPECMS